MSGSRDICILQASGEEGIFLAEFDLDRMREYRKNEVHGNAYRHPKKYGFLRKSELRNPLSAAITGRKNSWIMKKRYAENDCIPFL